MLSFSPDGMLAATRCGGSVSVLDLSKKCARGNFEILPDLQAAKIAVNWLTPGHRVPGWVLINFTKHGCWCSQKKSVFEILEKVG